MKMTARRAVLSGILALVLACDFWPGQAQQPTDSDQIRAGRALALKVCTACHLVLPDQESAPILRPPAPPFHSIALRRGTTADSLQGFLSGPHRNVGSAQNMPNPMLMDDQIRQVAAFVLSLRDRP